MSGIFDQSQGGHNLAPLHDPRLLSGDYWEELRIFLAVAKAKSFNRAGEGTKLSQATVSRAVKRLQDVLQVQLFTHSSTGITLTRSGQELAEQLLFVDQNIHSIIRNMRTDMDEAHGLVRITATEATAGFFITPGLLAFSQRYPNIQTHVLNPISLYEFSKNITDVLVGFGTIDEPGLKSQAAGYLHMIGVASAQYLEANGIPTMDNLSDHRFVDAAYYASKTPVFSSWRRIVGQGTVAHLCDNMFAYGLAVKTGAGIGLLGNFTLADPDLVPIGLNIHVRLPYYIHALNERLNDRAVKAVYDWLCDLFSPTRSVFAPALDVNVPCGNLALDAVNLIASVANAKPFPLTR